MKLEIFENLSDCNVVNKRLRKINDVDFKMLGDVELLYPTVLIKNYDGGNYCYIEKLSRYYYIDNITLLKGNLFEIDLIVDVLKTYSNDIEKGKFYKSDGVKEIIENNIDESEFKIDDKFLLLIGGFENA